MSHRGNCKCLSRIGDSSLQHRPFALMILRPDWRADTFKRGIMETKDNFMRFAVISAILIVGTLGLIVHFSS
jgi:hypothetical protein